MLQHKTPFFAPIAPVSSVSLLWMAARMCAVIA